MVAPCGFHKGRAWRGSGRSRSCTTDPRTILTEASVTPAPSLARHRCSRLLRAHSASRARHPGIELDRLQVRAVPRATDRQGALPPLVLRRLDGEAHGAVAFGPDEGTRLSRWDGQRVGEGAPFERDERTGPQLGAGQMIAQHKSHREATEETHRDARTVTGGTRTPSLCVRCEPVA